MSLFVAFTLVCDITPKSTFLTLRSTMMTLGKVFGDARVKVSQCRGCSYSADDHYDGSRGHEDTDKQNTRTHQHLVMSAAIAG